jgi:hypothetical protein
MGDKSVATHPYNGNRHDRRGTRPAAGLVGSSQSPPVLSRSQPMQDASHRTGAGIVVVWSTSCQLAPYRSRKPFVSFSCPRNVKWHARRRPGIEGEEEAKRPTEKLAELLVARSRSRGRVPRRPKHRESSVDGDWSSWARCRRVAPRVNDALSLADRSIYSLRRWRMQSRIWKNPSKSVILEIRFNCLPN